MEEGEQRDRSWSGSSNSWSIVDEEVDGLQTHIESDEEEEEVEPGEELAVDGLPMSSCLLSCSSTSSSQGAGEMLQELMSIHSSSSSSCKSQQHNKNPTNMSTSFSGEEEMDEDVEIHLDPEQDPREQDEDDSTTTTEIEEEDDFSEGEEESEVGDMCLVSEQEILDQNSAAKHFIEPGRVNKTLDELSKRNDPLVHRILDTLLHSTQKKSEKSGVESTKVVNWLFISLIVSVFATFAIYQIMERSWLAGNNSQDQQVADPGYYYHLSPPLYSSPVQWSQLPEVGLQSPPQQLSAKVDKKIPKHGMSNPFPDDGAEPPELSTRTPEASMLDQLDRKPPKGLSPPLRDTQKLSLEEQVKKLGMPACNLGPLSNEAAPSKSPSSGSAAIATRSQSQERRLSVFEDVIVDENLPSFRLAGKPGGKASRRPMSQPPRRVVEIQKVYDVFPTAESSFFGDKKLVRDMKQENYLQQCRLQLNDAKSAFANKDKVLHFVRLRKERQQDLVIQQLKAQLAEAERKLAVASAGPTTHTTSTQPQETCFAEQTEQVLANLTRSLKEKTSNFIESVHSFTNTTTSLSRFVQKTGKFSVKSLTRMSSWLRNQTKNIHKQPFVQQTQEQIKFLQSSWEELHDFSIFKTVPKFVDSLLHENWQNHMQTIVSSVSTALAPIFEHNFSLDDSFDGDELQEEGGNRFPFNMGPNEPLPCYTTEGEVEDDTQGWNNDNLSLDAKAEGRTMYEKRIKLRNRLALPPSNFLCDVSFAIAEALRATEQFGLQIGIKEANKYIGYLVNFPRKQCRNDSSFLVCEKCWWTGHCSPLVQCPQMREWQREHRVEPHHLLLNSPKLQAVFQELGWVVDTVSKAQTYESRQPSPPPSSHPPSEKYQENKKDWLVERSNWRQTLRQRQKLQLVEEAQRNWFLARAQHRQQMRQRQGDSSEGWSKKSRRRASAPYSMKWKKKSWKADADWLLARAAQRANLRQTRDGGGDDKL